MTFRFKRSPSVRHVTGTVKPSSSIIRCQLPRHKQRKTQHSIVSGCCYLSQKMFGYCSPVQNVNQGKGYFCGMLHWIYRESDLEIRIRNIVVTNPVVVLTYCNANHYCILCPFGKWSLWVLRSAKLSSWNFVDQMSPTKPSQLQGRRFHVEVNFMNAFWYWFELLSGMKAFIKILKSEVFKNISRIVHNKGFLTQKTVYWSDSIWFWFWFLFALIKVQVVILWTSPLNPHQMTGSLHTNDIDDIMSTVTVNLTNAQ